MLRIVRKLLALDGADGKYLLVDTHFDRNYYLASYPDVAASRLDPVAHYLQHGYREGRNPRADFDTAFYLAKYPDVAREGVNPFWHYLAYGQFESRITVPPGSHAADPAQPPSTANLSIVAASGVAPVEVHDVSSMGSTAAVSLAGDQAIHLQAVSIPASATAPAKLADRVPDLAEILRAPKFGFDVSKLAVRVDRTSAPDLDEVVQGRTEPSDLVDVDLVNHIVSRTQGRTLSLDIWDTMLRRHCFPDETKLRSARAIWLRHRVANHMVADLHPVDLLQIRRVCEAAAADDDFEYRLDDVARLIAKALGLDADGFVGEFSDTELRIEANAAFPDPTMMEVLRRHQGRKIAISDFYLSGSALAEILAAKGVDIAKVYASSDHMQTKRAGGLFDTVLAAEGITAGDMAHVGDKLDADVASPRIRGIDAFHYYGEANHRHAAGIEACFWRHVEGDAGSHHTKLLSLVERSDEKSVPLSAMAVVVTGFMLQVLEEALRNDVKTVFFCTREGVFFKQIYDRLVALDVYDLGQYPTSELLEVSRRATFAASMDDFNVPELMRLWSQYSSQSVAALATSLNIDLQGWQKEAVRVGLDVEHVTTYPWLDPKFQKFLDNRTVKAYARRRLWVQRQELRNYLKLAGFEPDAPIHRMLVDIGWRGTIQDNLARIVSGTVHGCYLGLERFLNPQSPNSTKSAYLVNANHGDDFRIAEVAGLEFLFNSLGGTVVAYDEGISVREILPEEERNLSSYTMKFQKQIAEATDRIGAYVRNHGLVSDDLRRLACSIVTRYSQEPPRNIVAAFYDLEHNEAFGVGAAQVMGNRREQLTDLLTAESSYLHGRVTKLLGDIRWPSAFIRSDEFGDLVAKLGPSQKLNLPVVASGPAILRRAALGRPLINVLSPAPIRGSGGHRTIYNLSRGLADAGFDVHLMHETAVDRETADWVTSVLGNSSVVQHNAWLNYLQPTAAISTIWYSPFFSSEFWGQDTNNFYFVQDFEAMFNPVGDTYLRAERSYTEGGNAICIGKWLPHMLRSLYGIGSLSAGLGVDHDVYLPLPKVKRGRKIAFLYQPEKFRRAPELCIKALSLVKGKMPDVEILVYGSDRRGHVPFEHEHLGLITDLHAINRLYNECMIGLCVSSTNPSRIPFEMMAAGCVPVDIYRYNNLFDYDAGCGFLAYHSPASLAAAMCELIENEEVCVQRAANGLASVRHRTMAWEVDAAVNAVAWGLDGGDFHELDIPTLSYEENAVVAEADDREAVHRFTAWQRQMALGNLR